MDAIETNDVTDSRQRYERALLQLAARLDRQGLHHRLVVDGRRGGDRIALVVLVEGELVELSIHRHTSDRGTACLLVESPAGAHGFAEAIEGAAGGISRLATMQRGCALAALHLARTLTVETEALYRGHPTRALDDLRTAFPEARPMVGLRAELAPASVFSSSARPDPRPEYGAVVPTQPGLRAARWNRAERCFELPPSARRGLLARFGALDSTTLAGMALAAPVASQLADDSTHDEHSLDLTDAADCGCDLLDLGCDAGFDLAGCFDVVPDCAGGLDCVPLDCGF